MGGKSSGNQTQTTSSEPWGPVQGYLKKAFPQIESEVLNKPKEYYPGSTVIPFSDQTETALNWAQQRAMAGSPLLRNAQGIVNMTAGGGFLPGMGSTSGPKGLPAMSPQPGQMATTNPVAPGVGHNGGPPMENAAGPAANPVNPGIPAGGSGNPWLDATVQKAQDSVRGRIDSQFASGGRYGSGMHMGSMASAYGDIATDIYGGAYESERARQMQAAGMAPGLAAADYNDIGMLANIGGQREAKAAEEMQDTVNRFNFSQDEGANRLRDYLALLNGGYGGSGTQTTTVSGGGGGGSDFGSTLLGLGSLALTAWNPAAGAAVGAAAGGLSPGAISAVRAGSHGYSPR